MKAMCLVHMQHGCHRVHKPRLQLCRQSRSRHRRKQRLVRERKQWSRSLRRTLLWLHEAASNIQPRQPCEPLAIAPGPYTESLVEVLRALYESLHPQRHPLLHSGGPSEPQPSPCACACLS